MKITAMHLETIMASRMLFKPTQETAEEPLLFGWVRLLWLRGLGGRLWVPALGENGTRRLAVAGRVREPQAGIARLGRGCRSRGIPAGNICNILAAAAM
jgi:hypothetical protein